MKSENYLIKAINLEGSPKSIFIDDIVLTGDKEELILKLKDLNYVKSLNIHESFWNEELELVPEDSIDFPDYMI